MGGRVIVKSRESHYGQAPYHAHSTYIQTSNQVVRDQNPIKKGRNNLETKKNYTKIKTFSHKFS